MNFKSHHSLCLHLFSAEAFFFCTEHRVLINTQNLIFFHLNTPESRVRVGPLLLTYMQVLLNKMHKQIAEVLVFLYLTDASFIIE